MVLMQQASNSNALLFIFAASTGLKDSHKRYSMFELEMLAISWSLHKIGMYLFGGRPITVMTDHVALANLEKCPLDPYASHRTQRTLEDILSYNIKHRSRKLGSWDPHSSKFKCTKVKLKILSLKCVFLLVKWAKNAKVNLLFQFLTPVKFSVSGPMY